MRTPILFVTAALLAFFLNKPVAEPIRLTTLETVSQSVVRLEVNGEEGSCTGWMYTNRKIITAGHCTDTLIKMEACFYPDFECKNPVELTFLGADHTRDVALFELPKGMYHEAIDISTGPKRLGDAVYAVGYPRRTLNVTQGLWVRRHKATDIPLWDEVETEWDQSTVLLAPGSSGGVLVNARGELIGMTVGHNGLGGNLDVAISVPVDVILEGLKNLSLGTGKTTTYGVP